MACVSILHNGRDVGNNLSIIEAEKKRVFLLLTLDLNIIHTNVMGVATSGLKRLLEPREME
jgi:hypothetical protein